MTNSDTYENLFQNSGGCSVIVSYDKQVPVFPAHWHAYAEVIYVIEGELTVSVDNQEYSLRDGKILFIWPGELHRIHPNEHPLTVLLQYNPDFPAQIPSLRKYQQLEPYIRIISCEEEPETFRTLADYIMEMNKHYPPQASDTEEDPFFDVHRGTLLLEFLAYLYSQKISGVRNMPGNHYDIPEKILPCILEACSYINENCTRNLSLDEAADHLGFSKYYFSRLFKKYTGKSYVRYLAECRIRRAKILLADPQMSILDVAMRTGFGSIASFNRVFLKFEGYTPSKFRSLLSA